MPGTRQPLVSGAFYPSDRRVLLKMLSSFISRSATKEACKAIICPHAGYIFSGKTAGLTYGRAEIPDTAIILGPNHTGFGPDYSISDADQWETPLGKTPLDKKLIRSLKEKCALLIEESSAHAGEHSIEVQLPFLQFINSNIKIVPFCLGGHPHNHAWGKIGKAIAEAVCEHSQKVILIASSDLTHYESEQNAKEKDLKAIESIIEMNEQLLVRKVIEEDISMCGLAPVVTAITASKLLGARQAELVRYTTSAEASGNKEQVVGYAGIIIK